MNTPKLRFKEFTGEWKNNSLGEIYSFKVTNSYSRENLNYEKGSVKNIHYGDIHTKFETWFDITKASVPFINSEISLNKITKDNYCQEGDVIMADASEDLNDVGKAIELINLNNERLLAGLHTILARPDLEKIAIGFGGYLFKSNKVRIQIQKESQGTKVLGVSPTRIAKIDLFYPAKLEQQKIASFFTSVDQKLTALKKKKELLEQYKKGVMQKIFSQKVRFKDENGNPFPEWEERKINELCEVVVGGTPSTLNESYWNGDIGWLSSGDLKNTEIYQPTKFITEAGLRNSSAKLMPKNTTLLAMTGATLGRIGILKFECSGNQSIAGFLPNDDFDSKYLFYVLSVSSSLILSKAGGAAQKGINKANIENLSFKFPSLSEQQKIADFLSAIDNKMNAVQQQIDKTEQWKKGLLQKMFV